MCGKPHNMHNQAEFKCHTTWANGHVGIYTQWVIDCFLANICQHQVWQTMDDNHKHDLKWNTACVHICNKTWARTLSNATETFPQRRESQWVLRESVCVGCDTCPDQKGSELKRPFQRGERQLHGSAWKCIQYVIWVYIAIVHVRLILTNPWGNLISTTRKPSCAWIQQYASINVLKCQGKPSKCTSEHACNIKFCTYAVSCC